MAGHHRHRHGAGHYVGLKADGTVEAVGENRDGQCDTAGWTGIAAVAAGGNRTFGLRRDGTVVIAGAKGCEAAADWRDVAALEASGDFVAGLTRDGRVLLAGELSQGMEEALNWTGVTAIAAGNAVSIGIRADGTALCAGGRYVREEQKITGNLRLKTTVVDDGNKGKLEPGMPLVALDHTGEAHLFSGDELECPDGADTTIRGMVFRLSPEGTWRRVANSFDPADCGYLAEKAARLEERFGGQFRFHAIFSAGDEEDEIEESDYWNFLKGAMELLLDLELRMEITPIENSELPHFLDADGNEYFFGWEIFVADTGLDWNITLAETGEKLELSEEEEENLLLSVLESLQDGEDPNWTEADEAWYQAWDASEDEEDVDSGYYEVKDGYLVIREAELAPLFIPFDRGETVTVRRSGFVLAGKYDLYGGDEEKIKEKISAMGGRCTTYVTKRTDYIVLGGAGAFYWDDRKHFVRARERIEQGAGLRLIREEDLAAALDSGL